LHEIETDENIKTQKMKTGKNLESMKNSEIRKNIKNNGSSVNSKISRVCLKY